jgi:hypothetical protein
MVLGFAILLALTASPAWAAAKHQPSGGGEGDFNAGELLVGGSSELNFGYSPGNWSAKGKTTTFDTTTVDFDALAGYFIIHGLEVGGFVNVGYTQTTISQPGAAHNTTSSSVPWGVGPEVGYFYGVASHFALMGLLEIGAGGTTLTTTPNKETESFAGFLIQVQPGVVVMINRSIGFSAAIYVKYIVGPSSVVTTQKTADGTTATVTSPGQASEPEFGLKIGLLGFI